MLKRFMSSNALFTRQLQSQLLLRKSFINSLQLQWFKIQHLFTTKIVLLFAPPVLHLYTSVHRDMPRN